MQGSSVAVGPDGEVYLAWADIDKTRSETKRIHVKRSTNGGSTFTDEYYVDTYQIGSLVQINNVIGYYLKGHRVRAISWPTVVVDRSVGPHRGKAYVVWSGRQSENGTADVLMIRGTPSGGGVNWSGIIPIAQSTVNLDWMGVPSVSPDGILSILYYNSNENFEEPIYTFLRYSIDGGGSFNQIAVGSPGGFNIENALTFLGDYHGLASWLGNAYAFWCENKDHGSYNKRQVYFRKVATQLTVPADYILVEVNQVDESNQPFDKIGKWNQGQFTEYKVPYTFLFKTGNLPLLEDYLDEIEAKREFADWEKFYKGLLLTRKKEYTESIELLKKAYQTEKSWEILYDLGILYKIKKNYLKSIGMFQNCEKDVTDKEKSMIRTSLADVLAISGNKKRAVKELKYALGLDNTNIRAVLLLDKLESE